MTTAKPIPAVSFKTARTGVSAKANALGMRPMQERAYNKRGEQYLLIKSPPASGKSRALMFIALDKLANQGLRQAIIVVPEKSIGGSFADEPLTKHGFWADWVVKPQWNLCNDPGVDEERVDPSKVKAVGQFLASGDPVLVCTHATFRFAVDALGIEAFDDRLIAVDEFHHVSANPDNRLGAQITAILARDKTNIVAMTGSYFRGDAAPVLSPEDETKFETVTYTYYEQLNGYDYLKALDISYFFYTGHYLEAIEHCLDPGRKTIVHIPSVNARESTKNKIKEVNDILHYLGKWKGPDPVTGFYLVAQPDGRELKIADLVDDSVPARRAKVLAALKDPAHKNNRDHVDIIIALGMAKEGFDWIWCEHALTIGYKSSLTEVVQIIGRATRDAPGKDVATFTNLIAEPDASEAAVAEAINDTLKAIAASLLMEQVLAPRFTFTPKNKGPLPDYDYGPDGYLEGKTNVGVREATGQLHFEIAGLIEPKSPEASRIVQQDLNEVIAAFVQTKSVAERGMFDEETPPQQLNDVAMGKIVRDRYPELTPEDQEAVRQHAIAALNLTQKAKGLVMASVREEADELRANTALLDGVKQIAMDVRELDIDMIDSINPWHAAYTVLAKAMNENTLRQVQAAISAKRTTITPEEAKELALRTVRFKRERNRSPSITSSDAWERRLAEGAAAFMRYKEEGRYE
jgi:superfamily II DNA or RNA helicase